MADLRNEIINKTLQWRFNTATYSTIWPAPDVYRNEGYINCMEIWKDNFWKGELLVGWRKALANFNRVTCMFLATMKMYKSDNIFYLSIYFFAFLKPTHFVLGRVKQANIIPFHSSFTWHTSQRASYQVLLLQLSYHIEDWTISEHVNVHEIHLDMLFKYCVGFILLLLLWLLQKLLLLRNREAELRVIKWGPLICRKL